LLELVEEKVSTSETHFSIMHCDADEEAHDLGEQVIAEAGSVIGTHAAQFMLKVLA